jgi:hypothetical protein
MSGTTKAAAAIATAALVGVGLKWGHDRQAGETEEPSIPHEAVIETDAGRVLALVWTVGAQPDGGILPEGVYGRVVSVGKTRPKALAKGVHLRNRAEAEWECAVALPTATNCRNDGEPAPVCVTLYGETSGDCTPAPCHAPEELGPDSAMPDACLAWMEGERVKANDAEKARREREQAAAGTP